MAYLVKPLAGEPLRMEMVQIREALERGTITPLWMARDERQDFWYSVAVLLGQTPAEPVRASCPQCRIGFSARHIDIGLPVPCPKCGRENTVPDPFLSEVRKRDEHRLVEAKRGAILGFVWFALAASVTIVTFLFRHRYGNQFLIWYPPLLLGLGYSLLKLHDAWQLWWKLRRDR
jgi:hypothetical protein